MSVGLLVRANWDWSSAGKATRERACTHTRARVAVAFSFIFVFEGIPKILLRFGFWLLFREFGIRVLVSDRSEWKPILCIPKGSMIFWKQQAANKRSGIRVRQIGLTFKQLSKQVRLRSNVSGTQNISPSSKVLLNAVESRDSSNAIYSVQCLVLPLMRLPGDRRCRFDSERFSSC